MQPRRNFRATECEEYREFDELELSFGCAVEKKQNGILKK